MLNKCVINFYRNLNGLEYIISVVFTLKRGIRFVVFFPVHCDVDVDRKVHVENGKYSFVHHTYAMRVKCEMKDLLMIIK